MTEHIYIAGPMRGRKWFNFDSFIEAEDILIQQGHSVFNPARRDLERGFNPIELNLAGTDEELAGQGFDLAAAMRHDFDYIVREATGVALLPGWANSTGARAEALVANLCGRKLWLFDKPRLVLVTVEITSTAGRLTIVNEFEAKKVTW